MLLKSLKRLFQFNRRERWGLFFLIVSLMSLYGVAALFPPRSLPAPPPESSRMKNPQEYGKQEVRQDERKHPATLIHSFDPNRIGMQEWVDLGISEKTAKTIGNYLAKGGRFRQAEDLRKIWGMDPADCDRLIPHVRIGGSSPIGASEYNGGAFRKTWHHAYPTRPDGRKERVLLDINGSDTAQWECLPGIGPGYARRIVRYRERLGGFVSKRQIGETYLLPDSVFQRILPFVKDQTDEPIHRLPLNSISIDSLGRHPYCGYTKARLIVRYREQHGPFSSIEELLSIVTLDEVWLNRIRPYLSL